MKPLKHIVAAVVSFLTGVPELTPRQKARLAEIEKEQAALPPPGLANQRGCTLRKL